MDPMTNKKTMVDAIEREVQHHYGRSHIVDKIISALQAHGVDIRRLRPEDLAPVDELHVRGREGTVELAKRVDWKPGMRVLDVGCGIGGSSRFLASTYGVDVTGIDLTKEFVEAATTLSEMVGLDGKVKFHQESALHMPFRDESYDVVWTQHVQMNIDDKQRFYAEMARVLKPGGKLMFHDVFQNGSAQPYYPMPWADDPSYSFLTTPENARSIIEGLDLEVRQWEDTTEKSRVWQEMLAEKAHQAAASGPGDMPLSPMVVLGEGSAQRMENAGRSLAEDRLRVVQAVAEK